MSERSIKFVDLHRQYESIKQEIKNKFDFIIDHSSFVGGLVLEEFELKLSDYTGAKYAIGCSDGTMALIIALRAAGLKKNDKVIVPTNSFIASANAVVHAGGIPVFADCDPHSFLIDLEYTETLLKKQKIRFIMPVHLYGNPCPMDDLELLSEKYNVGIIEDNAQALGALYNGKKTGTFGLASGISFYPAKNLGAFGQAGALLTDDEQIARSAVVLREQGSGKDRYYHEVIGYNGRMDTLQAGILSVLLEKLDSLNQNRLHVADEYSKYFPLNRIQKRTHNSKHVYHLFEYCCDDETQRSNIESSLKMNNIGYGFHYPVPIHKQVAYKEFNSLSLPHSESLAKTLISIPMHPFLSDDDVRYISSIINENIII